MRRASHKNVDNYHQQSTRNAAGAGLALGPGGVIISSFWSCEHLQEKRNQRSHFFRRWIQLRLIGQMHD